MGLFLACIVIALLFLRGYFSPVPVKPIGRDKRP